MNKHTSRQSKFKNRKKKKKRIKLFVSIVLFIPLIILGYTYYQFYDGKKEAEKAIASTPNQTTYEFNGQKSLEDKINVLLIGIDKRENDTSANSDSIIVAQFDPIKKSVKLLSLMRDMYVPIPGYNENYKINAANALGGPELLRKTIKENLGIDVEYFAMVDFKGFETIVDVLNPEGIEVDVEKAMSKYIGVSLNAGVQKLNGKELLGYARFRQDSESDFGRTRRQQQVIKVLMDEVISTNGITKAPRLLGSIQPYIETNISTGNSLGLIKEVLTNHPEKIESLTIPVKDTYQDVRVANGKNGMLVLQVDLEANQAAINEFFNQETPALAQ